MKVDVDSAGGYSGSVSALYRQTNRPYQHDETDVFQRDESGLMRDVEARKILVCCWLI